MSEQRLLEWWLPPEGAGDPVGCLATSFTFDTDFFRDDCLGRFIGLRGAVAEEGAGSLAQVNELEERLADVTACVIVDRSASIEGRNLRWDVLPVAVEGGLLHAKTALLLWEDAARVIIGSANLTPAGYRYQREFAGAFDLSPDSGMPQAFWSDYLAALEFIVDLAPDDLAASGPKGRSETVLSEFRDRIASASLPVKLKDERVAVILSRPGQSALDQLRAIMKDSRPRSLVAMSPFWDQDDQGETDAVRGLTRLLAQRGAADATFLVPLEVRPDGNLLRAPLDLAARVTRPGITAELGGVTDSHGAGEMDRRRLHAKGLLLQDENWLTFMWGSSNMTAAGLGLNKNHGHVELNVAYGSPSKSHLARELKRLMPESVPLIDAIQVEPNVDAEEELLRPPLPLGFVSALLERRDGSWFIAMQFDSARLPATWRVAASGRDILFEGDDVTASAISVSLEPNVGLPQSLQVSWLDKSGVWQTADWVVNVANPADLPLDERLRSIPIDAVVQALAQRVANPAAFLERLLDGLSEDSQVEYFESPLDPLKAFDDSRALLRRMGIYGRALDQLQAQLSRRVPTLSALGWRLTGLISPARLAEGWADQAASGEIPAELAHFLFAELQLVMQRVPWSEVTADLDPELVRNALDEHQQHWDRAYRRLPPLSNDHGVLEYVTSARGA